MYFRNKYDAIDGETKTYFVVCSLDTQSKLDDFFVKKRNFKKTETPIIVDDHQYFTLYQYRDPLTFSNMLLISSEGTQIIRDICKDCTGLTQMITNLNAYFSKVIQDPKIYSTVKAILPNVAKHFSSTKDQLGSPYIDADMTNKCICIFYPIYTAEIKGISIILSRLKMNEKGITNGRIANYL